MAHHPEQNGLVERTNQTLKNILRSMVHELQLQSSPEIMNLCPIVQWTINSTTNTTIGISPHEALFGVAPFIPHVFFDHDGLIIREEFIEKRLDNFKKVYDLVTNKLKAWNDKLVTEVNTKQRWIPNVDDMVLHIGPDHKSLNVKVPLFQGPYKVLAIDGGKVLLQKDKGTSLVSQKDLKPYIAPYEPLSVAEERWKISKINYRDYSMIVKNGFPSLNITWETGQTTSVIENDEMDPVIKEMEFNTHKSVGINLSNVSEVYAYQRLVLGIEIPILVNNGRDSSKVGHKRKKNLDPNKVIFQFVVKEDNVLGMVDDYDPLEQNWRVSWQDGQISWVPLHYPDENLYGNPGNTLVFKCSKSHLLDWMKKLVAHDDYLPLHYFLDSQGPSNLGSYLNDANRNIQKVFQWLRRSPKRS